MLKSISTLFNFAISYSKTNIEQTRSTFILRRKYEPRLSKLGGNPKKLKRRDYYYILEEDTRNKKVPIVEMVMLKNVKGIGNVGDVVQTSATKAYEYFILTGAGVLASPEILKKFSNLKKENAIPVEIQNLLSKLHQTPVPVFLHETNPWTLKPWHIKLSLRKIGIICNEECIKIPENPISGPNIDVEKKDFPITITVNQKYSVMMRCRIFHLTFAESNFNLAFNPKFYIEPIKAIFPEDQDVLEKIPVPNTGERFGFFITD